MELEVKGSVERVSSGRKPIPLRRGNRDPAFRLRSITRKSVPFRRLLITLWEQGVAGSNPAAPTTFDLSAVTFERTQVRRGPLQQLVEWPRTLQDRRRSLVAPATSPRTEGIDLYGTRQSPFLRRALPP